MSPTEVSSDEIFCERIRENISRSMNIELTQFDEPQVAELKNRPDLVHRRHGKLLIGLISFSLDELVYF